MTRGLQVVFCALLLTLTSSPAWGVCRPENRVWKIFSEPSKTAAADLDKTLEPRGESAGCGYDFASGVHKYLYGEDNPINNVDPSGNDLISLSVSMSIGSSLDSLYNGGVVITGNALQGTIMGAFEGQSENQILGSYYLNTAIGLAGGVLLGKVVGVFDEAIFGSEAEFTGSAAPEARAAVQDVEQSAVNAARASQLGAKGYGNADVMLPIELKEDGYLFSTTPPSRIKSGLWATDANGVSMADSSASAYTRGVQITPRKNPTIYAYKIKQRTAGAFGYARANAGEGGINGPGGFPQYYIRQQDIGNLEPAGHFQFPNP